MELLYRSLLSFSFRHTYFRKLSSAFTYAPQLETMDLMRKKGLLFKRTDNGFTILYQALKGEGEQTVPLRNLPEEFAFRFWITASFSHVGVVSDLPLMGSGSRILYFDNLHDRKDGDILYLNADAPGDPFAGDKDVIAVAPAIWRNEQDTADSVQIRVTDVFGNIVHVKVSPSVEGKARSLLELSEIGKGVMRLTPGTMDAESYYVPESAPPPGVFGAVDLYAGHGIPETYDFTDGNGTPMPKSFTCGIENRKSIWKYVVVPRFNTTLTAGMLTIEHGDGVHAFLPAVDTVTTSGEAAFLIESADSIPHSQIPVKGLALKRNGTNLIAELPNPGPEQIIAREDGFSAEVHVYV